MYVSVMQPYFFPYVGYYQLLDAADQLVFLDDVNYINRGWINRNHILVDGAAYLFTVPLAGASQNRLISEIEIAPDGRWKAKFLKLIRHAYAGAPMFDEAYGCIEALLTRGPTRISALAAGSIRAVTERLNMQTKLIFSSELEYDRSLKGQHKILAICRELGAQTYVNPIGGTGLYDPEAFHDKGLDLRFVKTNGIVYRQWEADTFVANLSMIDVLMFNAPEAVARLLSEYELVTREEVCGSHG
jgi:hypothetical protein